MSFTEFMFGSNKGDKAREMMFDKITNYDNRMNDFKQFSGQAMNNLSQRGILNSSTTSAAMGNAMAQADQNYMKNLGMASNFMPQNSQGMFPALVGAAANIGTKIGTMGMM